MNQGIKRPKPQGSETTMSQAKMELLIGLLGTIFLEIYYLILIH